MNNRPLIQLYKLMILLAIISTKMDSKIVFQNETVCFVKHGGNY